MQNLVKQDCTEIHLIKCYCQKTYGAEAVVLHHILCVRHYLTHSMLHWIPTTDDTNPLGPLTLVCCPGSWQISSWTITPLLVHLVWQPDFFKSQNTVILLLTACSRRKLIEYYNNWRIAGILFRHQNNTILKSNAYNFYDTFPNICFSPSFNMEFSIATLLSTMSSVILIISIIMCSAKSLVS